jgi:cobalamin biosynthesis Mg chelatase CobN
MFDDTTKGRHQEHIMAFRLKLEEKEKENKPKAEEIKTEEVKEKTEKVENEKVEKKDAKPAEKIKKEVENLNASGSSQNSTVVENSEKKETIVEQQLIKPTKKVNWIKAIFGSMFFVGCATGFYLLIRYRNKFR